MKYGNGVLVSVGDLVLTERGYGVVRGRSSLTPVGCVDVDFARAGESDWFRPGELRPVSTNAGRSFRGGGWDAGRVGLLVVAAVVGWSLLLAVVHAWVWLLGGLL